MRLAIAGLPADGALSDGKGDEEGLFSFARRSAFARPPSRHFFTLHTVSDGALLGGGGASGSVPLARYFLSVIALVILLGLTKPMRPVASRWQCS